MAEFGHEYGSGTIGHAFHFDSWGAGPFVLSYGGKLWRFEDSDRFGPSLIKKDGDHLKNPWPDERSKFWIGYEIWRDQGRTVGDDGITCIIRDPKPTTYRMGDGRRVVIDFGERHGATVEVL